MAFINILIAGCGAVGSTLAMTLCKQGHMVSVIDRSAESFLLLGADFSGLSVCGNPIDQDVLRQAGIEGCDAVAAVTASDNVNAMVSQVARHLFGIQKVITRIYDPTRRPLFDALGLHMICPTALTVEGAVSFFCGEGEGGQ